MATYVNDLRLKEIATGDESGTWGTSTNTNLELIGEALGYNTQDCFSSDADATTTVADGSSDPARAMYFKVTSSATLSATRTLTIGPNTISRVMFIENATTGSQSIAISQGSGANVTIATGKTAVVYLDGAGSGAAVVDAMLKVDPGVTDTLAEVLVAGNTSGGTGLVISSGDDLTLTGASSNAVWDSSANALAFADSSKAVFGTGNDLEIFHNASNSIINDNGTGTLQLQTGGATKLEVTSAGVTVTGTITGTLATAAQANVTSVGTLTSLAVSGDLTIDTNTLKVNSTTNRVGVLNASPDVSLDVGSATDAIHMPVGTTAQRPTGAAGYLRYNSTLEQFEGYTDDWGQIGGGGGSNTFATNSFTGNGSTTAYALSQVVTSEDNLLVFIEGVFQQQAAYSIATASGTTTLTFASAPANGRSILIYSVASAISGTNLNSDTMTGDGSDTTLTLSLAPVNENNTQVYIDGTYQHKDTYSISGTTLTFSTAPPLGTAVEVMTMNQLDINTPTDGSVTPAKIASGDFYFDTNTLYVDATNNRVGIGTDSPTQEVEIKAASVPTLKLNQAGTYGAEIALRGNDLDIAGSANNIVFYTGGNNDVSTTERIRIDSTGSIISSMAGGVFLKNSSGGTSATQILVSNTGGSMRAGVESSSGGTIQTGTSAYAAVFGNQGNYPTQFTTNGAVRATIDTSGNLLVGTTSNLDFSGVVASHNFTQTTNNRWIAGFRNATTGTPWGISVQYSATAPNSTSSNFLYLTDSAGLRCSVMSNGGVQNYQANDLNLSDRREKTNFLPAKSYLDVICAIPVQTFNYIDQNMEEDPSVTLGVVAQDVQTVAPELVKESNWGTEEDPKMRLSIYQTDFQYALMKCIQEQQATIESQATAITDLTTRLTALENN